MTSDTSSNNGAKRPSARNIRVDVDICPSAEILPTMEANGGVETPVVQLEKKRRGKAQQTPQPTGKALKTDSLSSPSRLKRSHSPDLPRLSTGSFAALPDEIVMIIIHFLQDVDLIRTSSTCRRFRDLVACEFLWQRRFIERWPLANPCRQPTITCITSPRQLEFSSFSISDTIGGDNIDLKYMNSVGRSMEQRMSASIGWRDCYSKKHIQEQRWKRGPQSFRTISLENCLSEKALQCSALDGDRLYVGNDAGEVGIVDLKTKSPAYMTKHHAASVEALHFNGQYAVTGSRDNTVRLFDKRTMKCINSFLGHAGLSSLSFVGGESDRGCEVVAGFDDGQIHLLDFRSPKIARKFCGHNHRVRNLQFSQGSLYSSSEGGGVIRRWEMATGTCTNRFTHIKQRGVGDILRFNVQNGRLLYTAKSPLIALDVDNGELVQQWGNDCDEYSIFRTDGSRGVSAGGNLCEEPITIWDMNRNEVMCKFPHKGAAAGHHSGGMCGCNSMLRDLWFDENRVIAIVNDDANENNRIMVHELREY